MPRAASGVPTSSLDAGSTRETILRTASRLFLAHGYEQSSMDQIALEAGVARRTLYNQFGGKKALFDATMAQMWNHMPLDAIIAATSAVQAPEEVLYTIGRTIARFWAPPEAVAFVRLVIWESARFPELGESFFDNGREPARRAVTEYVHRLSRKRGFRIGDPDLAAAQFIDVILGEVLLSRLVATSAPALDEERCDYVVHEAVTLFMTRYRPHS
jgi:AcrR family transcriptional regulator